MAQFHPSAYQPKNTGTMDAAVATNHESAQLKLQSHPEGLENVDEGAHFLFAQAPELVVKLLHLDGLRAHHVTRGVLSRKGLSKEAVARQEKFEQDAQIVQKVDAAVREAITGRDDSLPDLYDWYACNNFVPYADDFSHEELDIIEQVLDTSPFARIAYSELPLRDNRVRVQQFSGSTALYASVDKV